MNQNGCKGCARLMKVINSSNDIGRFCTTEKGTLYIVDYDWYKNNDCNEKTSEFTIKK